jgi:hypothetical protein
VVSKRLDNAIRDPMSRTYLSAIDGAWADLVLVEFAFLEDRGGSVDAIAFHQKGDYIRYSGPWGSVVLEFAPDNYPPLWLSSRAELHGHAGDFVGELETLRETRMPDRLPRVERLDEPTIAVHVRRWAEVLREATDLF